MLEVVDEVLDVAAGAEGAAAAGDDDAAHGGILIDLEGGVEELATEAEVERVVRVGAIEA
jgi:hypothetical protein